MGEVCAQSVHASKESIDLVLKRGDLIGHISKLVRVLEVGGAAIRSIDAVQGEVAASLAWGLTVAFDLSSLAFVAMKSQPHGRVWCGMATGVYQAIEM